MVPFRGVCNRSVLEGEAAAAAAELEAEAEVVVSEFDAELIDFTCEPRLVSSFTFIFEKFSSLLLLLLLEEEVSLDVVCINWHPVFRFSLIADLNTVYTHGVFKKRTISASTNADFGEVCSNDREISSSPSVSIGPANFS